MDDPQPDRHVETAEFAVARVGGGRKRRGWSPLLILGWAGVLSAVVGLGILGESSTGNAPGRIVRPTPPSQAAQAAAASPTTSARPDPLAYAITTDASGMTITGTSVAHPVVLVFVSVRTGNGTAVAWRSLGVEDPNGGFRRDHAPVFVTHIALPRTAIGSGLVVELTAFDDLGRNLGAVRSIVPSFGRVPPHLDVQFVR